MYEETESQKQQRQQNFTYHPPQGEQKNRYSSLRFQAEKLSKFFNEQCPPSRELCLAQTNLEQAVFWANAAIARNEKPEPIAAS